MGIESGPSGAVAVAGPAVGGMARARSALGSIGSFGPKFESVSYQPIDSPIGKGELENMVPYKVGMFDPQTHLPGEAKNQPGTHLEGVAVAIPGGGPELSVTDVVTEAEAIISEARVSVNPANPQNEPMSTSSVVEEAQYWLGLVEPKVEPDIKVPTIVNTLIHPSRVASDYIQPEIRRVARVVSAPTVSSQPEPVYAPVAQEQMVEQIIKVEQLKVEDKVEEPSETREEEKVEQLKLKYVEDEEVSRRRIYEIVEAIKKAGAEAEKEGVERIEGWRIKKYFQPEHASIRSGIAEPGIADLSLVETYDDVSARNYDSEEQANQIVNLVVADKKPVKKAKEGKKVKERDIARIRRDPFLKRHPVEEVMARIVRKTREEIKPGQKNMEVTTAVQTEDFAEGRIEDYLELSEVFSQKAA